MPIGYTYIQKEYNKPLMIFSFPKMVEKSYFFLIGPKSAHFCLSVQSIAINSTTIFWYETV